jgi:hypothetical protein
MNKVRIIIISLILAIGIFLIGKFIFQMVRNQPCWQKLIEGQENRYHTLFDSSEIKNFNNVFSSGNDKTDDYDFIYVYRNQYRIIIFERKSLNYIDPHKVQNYNIHFENNKNLINPSSGAEFGWGPGLTYKSAICLDFENTISIFFDNRSKPNIYDSTNYRCFNGEFYNILLKNENNENQFFLKYDNILGVPGRIFFYRANNSFYIIIVNSMSNKYDLRECDKILKLE